MLLIFCVYLVVLKKVSGKPFVYWFLKDVFEFMKTFRFCVLYSMMTISLKFSHFVLVSGEAVFSQYSHMGFTVILGCISVTLE